MQKIVPTTNQPVMLFLFFSLQTNGHGSEAVYQERLSRLENDKECLILQVREHNSQSVLDEPPSLTADSFVCHPQNTTVCVSHVLLEVCLTDGGWLPSVQIFSTCLFPWRLELKPNLCLLWVYFYPCGGAEEVLFGFPCLLLAINSLMFCYKPTRLFNTVQV